MQSISNQFGGLYDLYCIDIENLSRNIRLRRYETEHLFHRIGDSYIFPIFLFLLFPLSWGFLFCFSFLWFGGGGFLCLVLFCLFVCLVFFFFFLVFVYLHKLKFVSKL